MYVEKAYSTKISSTRVQHMVGSRDEMRWSPDIVGQWIARVPADHAWRTITRVDEMKRNGWVWRNGGLKFVVGENGRNSEKNLSRPHFVHETHLEWPETRTRDPSGERRASNRLRHEAASHIVLLIAICPSVGDVKPGGPLGAFREEQAMIRHRVSPSPFL